MLLHVTHVLNLKSVDMEQQISWGLQDLAGSSRIQEVVNDPS
jgi:hypothetical protein